MNKDRNNRINIMKLDKSIFETTTYQIVTLKEDVKGIRNNVKELLKLK